MKRILALLLTLLLIGALLAVPVLADEPARLVDDSAGLLTLEERDALEAKALELREMGMDAVIQIMPEEPDDPDAYADNYISEGGWGADDDRRPAWALRLKRLLQRRNGAL